MSFWQIIGKNLLGFDIIIFICAVLNGVFFWLTRKNAAELHGKIHLIVFVPSRRQDPESVLKEVSEIREEEYIELRKKTEVWYSLFVNMTAIFPLLGILGTVISLLPMVANMADMQTNFFAALTSTLWGLVFSIIFKVADGLISPRIEDNDRNVTLLLNRQEPLTVLQETPAEEEQDDEP